MDFRKLGQDGAIAIQGGQDSYSEAAARLYFGPDVEFIYCNMFEEAFEAVSTNLAVAAFIPTENTLAGVVTPVFELLPTARSYPVAEEYMLINHCLHVYAAPDDTRSAQAILDGVTDVYSHPVALKQCGDAVDKINADRQARNLPPVRVHEYEDTALAADKILRDKAPHQAAIASKPAGANRGLRTVAEGIQNKPKNKDQGTIDNYTRFAVFIPTPYICEPEEGQNYVTTLFVSIPENRPGALGMIATTLGKHACNMDHLHCTRKNHGTAEAIIELVGYHPHQPPLQNALAELKSLGILAAPIGVVPMNRDWMAQKLTPSKILGHQI